MSDFLYLLVTGFIESYLEVSHLTKKSEERWLSLEEISFHLGVSKESVYRWLEKKAIPSHKLGKLWKFKISEVDNWIASGDASIDGLKAASLSKLKRGSSK